MEIWATYVYGFNEENGRRALWKDLVKVASRQPLIILGECDSQTTTTSCIVLIIAS